MRLAGMSRNGLQKRYERNNLNVGDGAPPDEERVMKPVEGAATFQKSGKDYDAFMGRYSNPLAIAFADWAGVESGWSALDVGCGPGALTRVLAERLGATAVTACDPSAPFVAECRTRNQGVEFDRCSAEELPYQDDSKDVLLPQLVLHFVTDPRARMTSRRPCARPSSRRSGHPPEGSSSWPWLVLGAGSLPTPETASPRTTGHLRQLCEPSRVTPADQDERLAA